jgi:hypothetical protein
MFTVLWGLEAMEELTDLWIHADSMLRKAITTASHQIDQRLAHDPEDTGESRTGNERVWFVFPLGILFEVDHATTTVRVLQVWKYQKRK